MKATRNWRPPQIAVLLSLLIFSAGPRECYGNDPNYSFAGLSYRLVEDRTHIQYPVPADKKVQVDLRSTLFLLFEPPIVSGHTDKASSEWEGVQNLLDDANDLAEEYASLTDESININDPCAVARFQKRINTMRGKISMELYPKAEKHAEKFGLTQKEFRGLLTGSSGRPGYKVGRVYENLAYFLREQITNLEDEARRFRQEKDGYEVTVIALHKQAGGGTSKIHVDEYDNLPGGDPEPPRPLERYGIRMTPKELRRFRMEIKASQDAADMIREIMDNRDDISSGVKQLKKQLEMKLKNLANLFEADLKQMLTDSMRQLKIIEADPKTPAEVKNASIALRATLEGIQGDVDAAVSIVKQAKELRNDLVRDRTTDLLEVVAGASTILDSLNDLIRNMNGLQILKKAEDYLREIQKYAPVVAKRLTEEAAVKEIEEIATYLDNLPKTIALLSSVHSYMSGADHVEKATEILEDVADPVYHDIKDPPTAIIDLDQYRHMERNDGIIVKVIFRAKESEGLDGIEHIESYYLELEKLDMHTSVSASLIFARASSGTQQAKEWAPNVAAMVNWHYRNREPLDRGDKIWNWLNPGAGVHLASLDQGDDTVEFGVGANLSFWNGLLNAGYGYNLSQPEDREYFFVGLNLLHLLDVARGTASTPSWERGIDFR